MIDAPGSSVPGRELGVLGRGDVPVPMSGRERPGALSSRSRARESVASII